MSNEPLMRQAKLIPKGPPRIIYIYIHAVHMWLYIYNISLYVIVVMGTGGRLPVTIFPQIFHHYIGAFFHPISCKKSF